MDRLIIVYNPRSSKNISIQKEVLDEARGLQGVIFGRYEVKPTDVDDNAVSLAKILRDGDIVVTAGGDGTAAIGLNGVILSGKNVKFMALPYGNFNDLARTLGNKTIKDYTGKDTDFYPLEVLVDGKHWRYASCYVTMGLFAESTKVFDNKKIREKLKKGNKSRPIYSVIVLAKWYFKNRRREFMPEFKINGARAKKGTTDYIAVNGKTMAKMMKGTKNFLDSNLFSSTTTNFRKLFSLLWFMVRSILCHIPAKKTNNDVLNFKNLASVEIQAEGEYQRFENVKKIEIRKCKSPVHVILKT